MAVVKPHTIRTWKPLLEGEMWDRAERVIDEIVEELEARPPLDEPSFKGEASTVLLLERCGSAMAAERLDHVLKTSATMPMTSSLFGGAAGIGWLIGQVASGPEAAEAIACFDEAIERHLDANGRTERFDLMSGLVGIGVVAAERRDRAARRLGSRVLGHLEATAIWTETGATWKTAPRFLPEGRREKFPEGLFDLGVAHGVPGVIGMLARFVEVGLEARRSRRLLEAAVAWLLDAAPMKWPRFGASVPEERSTDRRIGWCYGDAGVAAMLLRAGRALRSKELIEESVRLLCALPKVVPQASWLDASFCHGAAGLAHIYHVAYRATRDPRLRLEAVRWIGEVLRLRAPGAGTAGYTFWRLDSGAPQRAEDATMLSGAVGVALVLLAAIEDREPSWQRLFLL